MTQLILKARGVYEVLHSGWRGPLKMAAIEYDLSKLSESAAKRYVQWATTGILTTGQGSDLIHNVLMKLFPFPCVRSAVGPRVKPDQLFLQADPELLDEIKKFTEVMAIKAKMRVGFEAPVDLFCLYREPQNCAHFRMFGMHSPSQVFKPLSRLLDTPQRRENGAKALQALKDGASILYTT